VAADVLNNVASAFDGSLTCLVVGSSSTCHTSGIFAPYV
jgi:hypothetical protein